MGVIEGYDVFRLKLTVNDLHFTVYRHYRQYNTYEMFLNTSTVVKLLKLFSFRLLLLLCRTDTSRVNGLKR